MENTVRTMVCSHLNRNPDIYGPEKQTCKKLKIEKYFFCKVNPEVSAARTCQDVLLKYSTDIEYYSLKTFVYVLIAVNLEIFPRKPQVPLPGDEN